MALFQQDHPALIDILDMDAAARQPFVGRHRQQKWIVEQLQRFNIGAFRRRRQHHAVELAAYELLKQEFGLCLAQLQPQPRIFRLQSGQYARQ